MQTLKDIRDKVDYFAEGVALLSHLGHEKGYLQLKNDLEKKYEMKFEKEAYIFDLLIKIESRAQEAMLPYQDQLDYYFHMEDEEKNDCAGRLLLLWDDGWRDDIESSAAYEKKITDLPEEEYCEKFGDHLQWWGDIVREDKPTIKCKTPIDVISYIMKMEISDIDKWKIQTIFMARQEHLKKVLALVDISTSVLKEFEKDLFRIGAEFKKYWTDKLGDKPLRDYIAVKLQMQLDDNPNGYILRPSFIMCNMVGVNTEADESGGGYLRPDCGIIGIIFREEFSLNTSIAQGEKAFENYAFSVLKLLSDRSKFDILSYIKDQSAYGGELAKRLNLTTPTISHHMSGLVTAGLVEMKKVENRIYYTANRKALGEVLDYCKKVLVERE